MTVVVVSKESWGVVTYRNVVSVTWNATNCVINDGSNHTYTNADYIVRIMEN